MRERGPFLYDGVTRSPIWPSFFPPLGRKKKAFSCQCLVIFFFSNIYMCTHKLAAMILTAKCCCCCIQVDSVWERRAERCFLSFLTEKKFKNPDDDWVMSRREVGGKHYWNTQNASMSLFTKYMDPFKSVTFLSTFFKKRKKKFGLLFLLSEFVCKRLNFDTRVLTEQLKIIKTLSILTQDGPHSSRSFGCLKVWFRIS